MYSLRISILWLRSELRTAARCEAHCVAPSSFLHLPKLWTWVVKMRIGKERWLPLHAHKHDGVRIAFPQLKYRHDTNSGYRKSIVTVVGESTAAGGLIEYTLVPEFAEKPVIPPAPKCAYSEIEELSETAASPEAGYVLSAESVPAGEGESLEGEEEEEAIVPLGVADVPRALVSKEIEDEKIVPQAFRSRLKRKRVVFDSDEDE